jgi:hypothetical protein
LRAFIDDNALRSETTCGSFLEKEVGATALENVVGAESAVDSLSPSRSGANSDEDNVEDPDYLMVSRGKQHIPTMGANFLVQ